MGCAVGWVAEVFGFGSCGLESALEEVKAKSSDTGGRGAME